MSSIGSRGALFLALTSWVTLLAGVLPAQANPLNQWSVSCSVDPGAITVKGKTRTFRTSTNRCEGGIFSQRAEIATKPIKPTDKGAYLFETNVSMTTESLQQFTIFQIHDGRLGCAPPLSLDVKPDGSLLMKSDIKTGPGENCIRGTLNDRQSKGRMSRDGTEKKLSVLVIFDGKGGFEVSVSIDGRPEISGRYDPSKQPKDFLSKKFYFKHGVYSQKMFTYVMTSREMKVARVKLVN